MYHKGFFSASQRLQASIQIHVWANLRIKKFFSGHSGDRWCKQIPQCLWSQPQGGGTAVTVTGRRQSLGSFPKHCFWKHLPPALNKSSGMEASCAPWPFTSRSHAAGRRGCFTKGSAEWPACLSSPLSPTMGPEALAASGVQRKGPR